MSITTYRYTDIECDRCGSSVRCHSRSEKRAIEWARWDGWSIGKQVLCPECNSTHQTRLEGEG